MAVKTLKLPELSPYFRRHRAVPFYSDRVRPTIHARRPWSRLKGLPLMEPRWPSTLDVMTKQWEPVGRGKNPLYYGFKDLAEVQKIQLPPTGVDPGTRCIKGERPPGNRPRARRRAGLPRIHVDTPRDGLLLRVRSGDTPAAGGGTGSPDGDPTRWRAQLFRLGRLGRKAARNMLQTRSQGKAPRPSAVSVLVRVQYNQQIKRLRFRRDRGFEGLVRAIQKAFRSKRRRLSLAYLDLAKGYVALNGDKDLRIAVRQVSGPALQSTGELFVVVSDERDRTHMAASPKSPVVEVGAKAPARRRPYEECFDEKDALVIAFGLAEQGDVWKLDRFMRRNDCDPRAVVGRNGDTLLHVGARDNNEMLVRYALGCGVEAHTRNKAGETALECCQKTHIGALTKMIADFVATSKGTQVAR